MSSLIFFISEHEALVATDTLVVDSVSRQPIRHCSKALYLPHVNTIFAGTGVAGLMNDWCFFVNDRIATADVDTLSTSAPEFLRETFKGYKENGIEDDLTVTVYHFGISLNDNVIKAYAHRSKTGL